MGLPPSLPLGGAHLGLGVSAEGGRWGGALAAGQVGRDPRLGPLRETSLLGLSRVPRRQTSPSLRAPPAAGSPLAGIWAPPNRCNGKGCHVCPPGEGLSLALTSALFSLARQFGECSSPHPMLPAPPFYSVLTPQLPFLVSPERSR